MTTRTPPAERGAFEEALIALCHAYQRWHDHGDREQAGYLDARAAVIFTAQDLAADLLDSRAEIATLREQLAKVCEVGKDLRDTAFCDVMVVLDCPRGDCDCCTCEAVGKFDAAIAARVALSRPQPTSEQAERLMPTEKRLVRRLMETLNIKTCRDHSCVYATEPIRGMGTNGGCRCTSNVESAVFDLMQLTQPTSEGEEREARRAIWELIMAAGGEIRVPNAIALQSSPTSRIEKYDDNAADCVVWRVQP